MAIERMKRLTMVSAKGTDSCNWKLELELELKLKYTGDHFHGVFHFPEKCAEAFTLPGGKCRSILTLLHLVMPNGKVCTMPPPTRSKPLIFPFAEKSECYWSTFSKKLTEKTFEFSGKTTGKGNVSNM